VPTYPWILIQGQEESDKRTIDRPTICARVHAYVVRARTVRPVQRRRIQQKIPVEKETSRSMERSNPSRTHTCRNRSLTCRARVHIPSSSASWGRQPRLARLIIRCCRGRSLDCDLLGLAAPNRATDHGLAVSDFAANCKKFRVSPSTTDQDLVPIGVLFT
jgi:hypothetical protein